MPGSPVDWYWDIRKPEGKVMTEQKRKRGRPRKIKLPVDGVEIKPIERELKRGRPRKIKEDAAEVGSIDPKQGIGGVDTTHLYGMVEKKKRGRPRKVQLAGDQEPKREPVNTEKEIYAALTYKMVLLLLEGGADVNARNTHGETALMLAARLNDPSLVKLLAHTYRADDGLQDYRGKTARAQAVELGFTDIVALLDG